MELFTLISIFAISAVVGVLMARDSTNQELLTVRVRSEKNKGR
ncbi:MAG: hypothetical protein WBX15_07635 [Thermoanaerobaculia bacterium]